MSIKFSSGKGSLLSTNSKHGCSNAQNICFPNLYNAINVSGSNLYRKLLGQFQRSCVFTVRDPHKYLLTACIPSHEEKTSKDLSRRNSFSDFSFYPRKFFYFGDVFFPSNFCCTAMSKNLSRLLSFICRFHCCICEILLNLNSITTNEKATKTGHTGAETAQEKRNLSLLLVPVDHSNDKGESSQTKHKEAQNCIKTQNFYRQVILRVLSSNFFRQTKFYFSFRRPLFSSRNSAVLSINEVISMPSWKKSLALFALLRAVLFSMPISGGKLALKHVLYSFFPFSKIRSGYSRRRCFLFVTGGFYA